MSPATRSSAVVLTVLLLLGHGSSSSAATLVSHWKFDESGGATAADSTGAFDGTLSGGAAFVAGGISGNALSLDESTNSLVNMGTSFPGFLGGDFSIVLWIKTASTANDTLVVAKHEAFSENGYFVSVNPTGGGGTTTKATFFASELVANSVTSATSVTDDVWHQIVGVYRAGVSQSIYVDGGPVETTGGVAPIVANNAPFLVGGPNTSGMPNATTTALVDELQVYASALTDAEIDYLFAHPGRAVPAAIDDLAADWSDAQNPNGPWIYREGNNALPQVAAWETGTGSFSAAQPGWARSETATDRIPFWFRNVGAENFTTDLEAGDVVVHTTDATNGVGNGNGNVVWTSPFTGAVDVSGAVWMGRDIGRSNDWFLYRNATLLSQGSIASGDAFDRAHPMPLVSGTGGAAALSDILVTTGDLIRLELAKNSTFGDFVGVNLSIAQVPTPTPTATPTATATPTPTATPTGVPAALGHFVLYKVATTKGTAKLVKFGAITLASAGATGNYDVVKLTGLAAPADKNGEGFTDADTHLGAYGVKVAKGSVAPAKQVDVRVANQCGEVSVTLGKPATLLVPTAKSLVAPVPPPNEGDHDVDHFLCRQAKAQKKRADGAPATPFPKKVQVDVTDQFQTRRYDLKKVVQLCTPVSKSGSPVLLAGPDKGAAKTITPSTLRNPASHLLCYQAAVAKKLIAQNGCGPVDPADKGTALPSPGAHVPRLGVHVANQFGAAQVDTKKETLLCIPSTLP